MKNNPLSCLCIALCLVFLNAALFSQHKQETYSGNLVLSLKAGYHTSYRISSDNGFPDGSVFGGSIAVGTGKNFLIGFNFDYWKRKDVSVQPSLTNITLSKNYSGFGFRFFVQYRRTLFGKLDLYADAGIGQYRISYNYMSGSTYNSDNNGYLNSAVSFGAGWKLTKYLILNAELSHSGLVSFDVGGSSSARITHIKFGPTLFFKMK